MKSFITLFMDLLNQNSKKQNIWHFLGENRDKQPLFFSLLQN